MFFFLNLAIYMWRQKWLVISVDQRLVLITPRSWVQSPGRPQKVFLLITQGGYMLRASQVVLVIKNLPVNGGDLRDMCLIPAWGRSPGEENSNPLQYSCGNPWREEPGRLQSLSMTEHTHTHTQKWGNVLFMIATQSYILKTTQKQI